MVSAGLRAPLFPMHELSVMGFSLELLGSLPRLWWRLRQTVADVLVRRPDVVVTVDSKGFSARLARRVVAMHGARAPGSGGGCRPLLVQLVAPSVWAVASDDAAATAAARDFAGNGFDCVLAVLPWEQALWRRAGVPCRYVGYPALDSARAALRCADAADAAAGAGVGGRRGVQWAATEAKASTAGAAGAAAAAPAAGAGVALPLPGPREMWPLPAPAPPDAAAVSACADDFARLRAGLRRWPFAATGAGAAVTVRESVGVHEGGQGGSVLALCLGSRRQELRRALPIAHAAVQRLAGGAPSAGAGAAVADAAGTKTCSGAAGGAGAGAGAGRSHEPLRAIILPVVGVLAAEAEATARSLEWPAPLHVMRMDGLVAGGGGGSGGEDAGANAGAGAGGGTDEDAHDTRRLAVLAAADVALAVSGTVTVELAAVGTPTVVIYPASPLTAWIAQRLARVRFASLLNIMRDAAVVPELLFAAGADAGKVAAALRRLLPPRGGNAARGGRGLEGAAGRDGARAPAETVLAATGKEQRRRVRQLLPHLLCWGGGGGCDRGGGGGHHVPHFGGSLPACDAAAAAIWELVYAQRR
eukprot:g6214.t1